MFQQFKNPPPLDRKGKPFNYVTWSFDKAQGRTLPAEEVGHDFADGEGNFELKAASPRVRDRALIEGFRGRALQFDGDSGELLAKAKFPTLSGSKPRTIAFWVKVPANAQLSNAYSMVAWRADSGQLGRRPVHIGWNRNPAEGPLGAIRTDFSGGHAMGMTPLRDGRWHHVSVIFLPDADADAPVQVKQYVDGRLESNTVTPGERRSIGANAKVDADPESADWLWLGCRLGANGPKRERFRGEIDELVIADRSLEPSEVVQLMDGLK
jgi:Concanavalin A-like lectin/glucanases superfamily